MRGHTAADLEPRPLDVPTYADPDGGAPEPCCHVCGHTLGDFGFGCPCAVVATGSRGRSLGFRQRRPRRPVP